MKQLILTVLLLAVLTNPQDKTRLGAEFIRLFHSLTNAAFRQELLLSEPVSPIGLYIYNENSGRRELAGETSDSAWIKGTDIVSFEVYNSSEAFLRGNVFLNIWPKLWESWEHSSDYRIGYTIDFTLNNGTKKIHQNVVTPDDTLIWKDYIELYLYDDLHQQIDVWYSHVEPEDYTDETILTSVKFTAGREFEAIDDEILLTAYFYKKDGSEFDSEGNYTGNTCVRVLIRNKN